MTKYVWSAARMSDHNHKLVDSVRREAEHDKANPVDIDRRRGEWYALQACKRLLYTPAECEHVLGIGLVYMKDELVHVCKTGWVNPFAQLMENGFITYQCDGLVTINWKQVTEFVEEAIK